VCNQTVAAAWEEAQYTIELAAKREQPVADFDLNVHILVVDGSRVLADSADGDDAMCQDFADFVEQTYLGK
jgi:hypothetical protein